MPTAERPTARLRRVRAAALALLLFVLLYAVTNLTAAGQVAEDSVVSGWMLSPKPIDVIYHDLGLPPFRLEVPTIVIGTALALGIAALRRRWRDLLVVLIATPSAIASTSLFKDLVGRPHLVASRDVDASYPSGHFAVAAALSLALLIVVPRSWLRWLAPLLLAWTAVAGAGVQSLGWHRPSDVVGGALLVVAVFLLVGTLLPGGAQTERIDLPPRVLIPAAGATLALTVLAAWRPHPWTIPIVTLTALIGAGVVVVAGLRLCRAGSDETPGTAKDPRSGERSRAFRTPPGT